MFIHCNSLFVKYEKNNLFINNKLLLDAFFVFFKSVNFWSEKYCSNCKYSNYYAIRIIIYLRYKYKLYRLLEDMDKKFEVTFTIYKKIRNCLKFLRILLILGK